MHSLWGNAKDMVGGRIWKGLRKSDDMKTLFKMHRKKSFPSQNMQVEDVLRGEGHPVMPAVVGIQELNQRKKLCDYTNAAKPCQNPFAEGYEGRG